MKVLLLLLLLANLLFFGAFNGWLGESVRVAVVPEQREPTRMAQQVGASRVELLVPRLGAAPAAAPTAAPDAASIDSGNASGAEAQPATSAPAPPASTTAPTPSAPAPAVPASAAAPGAALPAAATVAVGPAACLELSGLIEDDAKRIAERVRADKLASVVAVRPAAETPTWMVYLPAYATRAEADRAASELRKKGFEDFFVIQDNSNMRNAISLGVFSSEDGANGRVATLTSRGFKGAKVMARTSGVQRSRVEARQVRADARTALAQYAKEFPGGEWRECAVTPARKG